MESIRNVGTGVSAADVLTPVWRGDVADLRIWETEVRLRRPESVHRFRVAARRLRSHLAAFEPLLGTTVCRGLQDDLRGAAAAVGGTRDVEVVQERIERLRVDGAAGTTSTALLLTGFLDRSRGVSWGQGLEYLDSPAYDACTRALEAFSDMPPWLPAAGAPAEETLAPILRLEWSRLRDRMRIALDPEGPESGSTRCGRPRSGLATSPRRSSRFWGRRPSA